VPTAAVPLVQPIENTPAVHARGKEKGRGRGGCKPGVRDRKSRREKEIRG